MAIVDGMIKKVGGGDSCCPQRNVLGNTVAVMMMIMWTTSMCTCFEMVGETQLTFPCVKP